MFSEFLSGNKLRGFTSEGERENVKKVFKNKGNFVNGRN